MQSTLKLIGILALAQVASASFAAKSAPEINWQQCAEMPDSVFECATVSLPLNHLDPSDPATVDIAIARLPAADQQNKKGSLFLNPGGPGGSGVDWLFGAGEYLFNPQVRAAYDIVGFDPRGIARSTPIQCFDSFEELAIFDYLGIFPDSYQEIENQYHFDQAISDLCAARAGDIINHMSTADVARDLDLLRAAVGDNELHYFGVSYGSYIGSTYAELFPNRVGHMVIDSVLDPIAWSSGQNWSSLFTPVTTRLQSHVGAFDSLNEFFRTCEEGGIDQCPFAGDSELRFSILASQLRARPETLYFEDGSSFEYTYQVLVADAAYFMYNPYTWPDFAHMLAWLESVVNARDLDKAPLLSAYESSSTFANRHIAYDANKTYADGIPQPYVDFLGVICSDSDNPHYVEAWPISAWTADAFYGYFGSYWTWASSPCQKWQSTKESRYAGNFKTKPKNPVLVINTLFDPATPLHGAQMANSLIQDSRLITINGWGHGAMFVSSCADQLVSDYLLHEQAPESGVMCDADWAPFNASLPQANVPFAPRTLMRMSRGFDIEQKRKLKDVLIEQILVK